MSTDIDWSTRPEPYCWIGPRFRRECEKIAGIPLTPYQPPISDAAREIRSRRKAMGLSQDKVAVASGISRAMVSLAEIGKAGRRSVDRILAALDRIEAERQAEAAVE